MTLLVAGLVLFIAVHLIPTVVPLRAVLIERLGARPYRGLFSLVAAAGLILIVWGFARAPFEPLYAPPAWGRQVAMFAVPVALVLFAAANMPTHIRAVLRHPMLLGLLLWAIAHLLANGDLRSVVLFGGFAGYAVVDFASAVARDQRQSTDKAPRLAMDGVAIVAGLVAAALLAVFHGALFGVPVTWDVAASRPDILRVMNDDMGSSDIGCRAGEVQADYLDRLLTNGVRFTQFEHAARCCPAGVNSHRSRPLGLVRVQERLQCWRGGPSRRWTERSGKRRGRTRAPGPVTRPASGVSLLRQIGG